MNIHTIETERKTETEHNRKTMIFRRVVGPEYISKVHIIPILPICAYQTLPILNILAFFDTSSFIFIIEPEEEIHALLTVNANQALYQDLFPVLSLSMTPHNPRKSCSFAEAKTSVVDSRARFGQYGL